jgi:hypothetical protein
MHKVKNRVNLDKTLSYTSSSNSYKDPYNPNWNLIMKMKNKVRTFLNVRNIENEFIDFKPFYIENQF